MLVIMWFRIQNWFFAAKVLPEIKVALVYFGSFSSLWLKVWRPHASAGALVTEWGYNKRSVGCRMPRFVIWRSWENPSTQRGNNDAVHADSAEVVVPSSCTLVEFLRFSNNKNEHNASVLPKCLAKGRIPMRLQIYKHFLTSCSKCGEKMLHRVKIYAIVSCR